MIDNGMFIMVTLSNNCRSGPMVAKFKYSTVAIYNVSVPPQKLEFSNSIRQEWLRKETENVCLPLYPIFCFVIMLCVSFGMFHSTFC